MGLERGGRSSRRLGVIHRTHRRRVARCSVRAHAGSEHRSAPPAIGLVIALTRSHALTDQLLVWLPNSACGCFKYIGAREALPVLLVWSADGPETHRTAASCGVLPAHGLLGGRTSENRPVPEAEQGHASCCHPSQAALRRRPSVPRPCHSHMGKEWNDSSHGVCGMLRPDKGANKCTIDRRQARSCWRPDDETSGAPYP